MFARKATKGAEALKTLVYLNVPVDNSLAVYEDESIQQLSSVCPQYIQRELIPTTHIML